MKLEVVQVDELAAIAAGNVLGTGEFVNVRSGRDTGAAVSCVCDNRFAFRYFRHC